MLVAIADAGILSIRRISHARCTWVKEAYKHGSKEDSIYNRAKSFDKLDIAHVM